MSVSRYRRSASDAGFTLIELLVTIVVLGIIAFPVSNVIINYLLNSSTTTTRLSESSDEQIAAAYWQQDVASIGIRVTTPVGGQLPFQSAGAVNLPFPCAAPAGATKLITLAWNQYDTSGTATQKTVFYGTKDAGKTLVRSSCSGTGGGATSTGTSTLMRHLSGTPTCQFNSGSSVACDSVTNTTPSTISITLHVDSAGGGQSYDVTLRGERRQT